METGKIKRFATDARNVLLKGVAQRFTALGFNQDGSVSEMPQRHEGGATFMGDTVSIDFYDKWMSLHHAVEQRGVRAVIEEAAYTWFNRMVAIRILVKNGLISPVLSYVSEDVRLPLIIAEARQGRLPQMDMGSKEKLAELLEDDSRLVEQFALLIVAWCHVNPIINACFGAISDYTELLLPRNILSEGGFIDMLNNTQFIPEDDYKSPELIGWLYQFYISERKDEVFAKKGKFEADEIPAATQIFTPNWIVKYMVENTVGRIYLDNNPYSDEIKESMRYLVEPSGPIPEDAKLRVDDLKELTCADLACGSGHILNECFDLLFRLYMDEGYSRRDAIENIFRHNLTGIDIDLRAKQLATFALLLKACQKDESFADAHILPRVMNMPEPYADKAELQRVLPKFLLGSDSEMIEEIVEAFTLMDNADCLGSIMKFNISDRTRNVIAVRMEEFEAEDIVPTEIRALFPYMRLILALTATYAAIVMNPPYMTAGNMTNILSNYVSKKYSSGSADLMTVFMLLAQQKTMVSGLWAMIDLPSWMFLPSFEEYREELLSSQSIMSLVYNGRGIFGSDFGSVAFTIRNSIIESSVGVYRKLFKIQGQVQTNEEIQKTFLNPSDGLYVFPQNEFNKIPSQAIAFWLPMKVLDSFKHPIRECGTAKKGLSTGDNNRFLRLWHEVSQNESSYYLKHDDPSIKWIPINKGGSYRKWYGNNEYVINWLDNGAEIKSFKGSVIRNPQFYFRKSLTWTMLSASCFGIRYSDEGKIFEGAGPSLFMEKEEFYTLGFLCSCVGDMIIRALNPTVNININDVLNLPLIIAKEPNLAISKMTKDNVNISKEDWDAHETSWDFQQNELMKIDADEAERIICNRPVEMVSEEADRLRQTNLLSIRLELYTDKWWKLFQQLHANEEKLNKMFIEIYGLQEELTPDVRFDEITILQQGEIRIEKDCNPDLVGQLHKAYMDEASFNWDNIIKQFLSYAFGCLMGRYSIDKPGLILANQGDTEEEYYRLVPNSRFEIDADGIIPLMPDDTWFADNATKRFKRWLEIALGEEHLNENLNFIEKCIGKSIETYFMKDFWKDHKKMYSNRPIYWLFSSKKGAFQCAVYMHRMNPYTAERVRTKYLLPHIEWLVAQQEEMQGRESSLTTRERKQLDNIGKQIAECREYHDRLHVVADEQIPIDLDNGVIHNYALFGDVLSKLK